MHTRLFEVTRADSAFLAIVPRPRGGDWLEDDIDSLHAQGIRCVVSLLTRAEEDELNLLGEGDCCRAAGIEFVSVPVTDLGVPTDIARFRATVVKAVALMRRGVSIGVHCRQSIGRSGFFACAVLVALGVSTAEAMSTVSAIRGVTVPETPEQRLWLEQQAERFAQTE